MTTSFKLTAYKGALTDLTAGSLTSTTTMSALMLNGSYSFGFGHAFTAITPYEITTTGYARCTRSTTFTVANQGQYWWFYNPSPTINFATFTGSFRSILLYNATTNQPYMLAKANTLVNLTAQSFTLSSGGPPWLIVSAQ